MTDKPKPVIPEARHHAYTWEGGRISFSQEPYNGTKPDDYVALYTVQQLTDFAAAAANQTKNEALEIIAQHAAFAKEVHAQFAIAEAYKQLMLLDRLTAQLMGIWP